MDSCIAFLIVRIACMGLLALLLRWGAAGTVSGGR